jgi:hypothetical protein
MKFRVLALALVAGFLVGDLNAQHKYPGNLTPVPAQNAPNAPVSTQAQPESSEPTAPAAIPNSMQPNGIQQNVPRKTSAPTVNAPSDQSTMGTAAGRRLACEVQVKGNKTWTDTGIQLVAGDRVKVSSTGSLDYNQAKATPDGLARSLREVITSLPVNDAGIGALIGRIGDATGEVPFVIGSSRDFTANHAGTLYLGVNESATDAGAGSYKVSVKITPASATRMQSLAPLNFPSDNWAKVPRRVSDQDGNPGDMVNFIVIGPQQALQKAFADAGWVVVDKTKQEAILHALLSTYTKKAYTEMPMSELYLFGRSQDFGYARAEPVQVVQTRHHLRIWKAPFEVDGQPVWVGAATHDIGFEHDNRSTKASAITHKIDPNVDTERDFVGETLNATGEVAKMAKMTPPDPLRGTTKTATGGEFHSDGQVLVMELSQ